MTDLGQDQEAIRQSIQRGAGIFGAIVGAIVAAIAYFALGSMDGLVRSGGAIVLGAAAAFGIYRWRFSSASAAAQCAKCGAAYSISRTDRQEVLVGSDNKSSVTDKDDGSSELKTWVEDKFDVTDTYTCAKCGDATTKAYQTTKTRDEETHVKPAKTPMGSDDSVGLARVVDDAMASEASSAKSQAKSKLGRADSSRD